MTVYTVVLVCFVSHVDYLGLDAPCVQAHKLMLLIFVAYAN